jgi:small-conductance mechanosensitive channel
LRTINWNLYVEYFVGFGAFFGVAMLLLLLRSWSFLKLRSYTRHTQTDYDDRLVEIFSKPSYLLIFVASLSVALQFLPDFLRTHPATIMALKLSVILLLFWVFVALLNFFVFDRLLEKHLSPPTFKVVKICVRLIFYSIALLVILDTLGISITPFLASLGVGSIAVALAVQSTLGNLFSGFYIMLDKPVRVGDYVRVSNALEGYVTRIGWRSTRVRTLANNTCILPNSKLADTEITNFSLPESEMSVVVDLAISYDNDLEKVESVVVAAAREAQKTVPGAVADFEPFIRYNRWSDWGLVFSLNLRVHEFSAQYLLVHSALRMVHARFQEENIALLYQQKGVQPVARPSSDTN